MAKRSITTKDIGLLAQIHRQGQLLLAPEFQRESVWPPKAKAYLIDTILNDRPIPLIYLQRSTSPQTGAQAYTVIDGQQRLRAIFDFLENGFRLTQSNAKSLSNRRFAELAPADQERLLNYDLIVEELSGYSLAEIEDIFVRMNKYVVRLSAQELRHAREKGQFKEYVEELGRQTFWLSNRIFSPGQARRMRPQEFSAELTILLIEGPQDKKKAIDLYYHRYRRSFPERKVVQQRLMMYLNWLGSSLPLRSTRFRRPVDLYSLVGALDEAAGGGRSFRRIATPESARRLRTFDTARRRPTLSGRVAQYVAAASRQTDNIGPRRVRIETLLDVLSR